jgi:iron complex outermembrane receptor protein
VNGTLTVGAAMTRALSGSGLVCESTADGALVVRAAGSAAAGTPVAGPDERLVVTGDTEREPGLKDASGAALFGDTPLIETPFTVGVYAQGLMENQRAFTLDQVLRNDPGVSTAGAGSAQFYNTQTYLIRGFALDPWASYRIDGMQYVHTVEPALDDIERVEVLKGPAALRYGFAPSGGIVNLVRKKPTERFATSLQLDVDTWGGVYGQADTGGRVLDGALGYRVVVAGDQYDSFYDDADGDRLFFSGYVDWRINKQVTLWVAASTQERERSTYSGGMISDTGDTVFGDPSDNFFQPWAYTEQSSDNIAAGADIALTDGWQVRATWSLNQTDREGALNWVWAYDNGDYDVGAFMMDQSWTSQNAEVVIEGRFATGPLVHDVAFGGSLLMTESSWPPRSFPYLGTNNVYLPEQVFARPAWPTGKYTFYESAEYGLFATDTIAITERVSTLLGVRYSSLDSDDFDQGGARTGGYDDDAVNPAFALMYEPIDDLHTYLSFSQGNQAGGVVGGTFANAGSQLPPLESMQVQLGAKSVFLDGRWSGEVAVFRIEQDLVVTDGDNRQVQEGLQVHNGLELSVWGHVADPVLVGLSGMFLDAEIDDTDIAAQEGKRPNNVPTYQARLWADWEVVQLPGLGFSANAYAVSDRYADNTETWEYDGHVVFNVGARYRWRMGPTAWTARLNVENLFDEEYYLSADTVDDNNLEWGSPLAARFSLQAEF